MAHPGAFTKTQVTKLARPLARLGAANQSHSWRGRTYRYGAATDHTPNPKHKQQGGGTHNPPQCQPPHNKTGRGSTTPHPHRAPTPASHPTQPPPHRPTNSTNPNPFRPQPRCEQPMPRWYADSRWRTVRARILDRDAYRCQIAGPRCTGTATQVDHIIPISKGGQWLEPTNLRAACRNCNRDRVGKGVDDETTEPRRHAPPSRRW